MTSHRISWYAQPDVFYHSEDSLRALQQLEGRLESETKRCSRLEAAVEDARVQLSKHNNELSRAEEARKQAEDALRQKCDELAEANRALETIRDAGFTPNLVPELLNTITLIGQLRDSVV